MTFTIADTGLPSERVQVSETGCWIWTGNRAGGGALRLYGQLRVPNTPDPNPRRKGSVMDYAHRVSYRATKGPIPDGWHIDHLCRVQLCVNPAHLEAVTPAENNRRKFAARAAEAERAA